MRPQPTKAWQDYCSGRISTRPQLSAAYARQRLDGDGMAVDPFERFLSEAENDTSINLTVLRPLVRPSDLYTAADITFMTAADWQSTPPDFGRFIARGVRRLRRKAGIPLYVAKFVHSRMSLDCYINHTSFGTGFTSSERTTLNLLLANTSDKPRDCHPTMFGWRLARETPEPQTSHRLHITPTRFLNINR